MDKETSEELDQIESKGTSAWVIAFSGLALSGFAAGLFAGWLIWG